MRVRRQIQSDARRAIACDCLYPPEWRLQRDRLIRAKNSFKRAKILRKQKVPAILWSADHNLIRTVPSHLDWLVDPRHPDDNLEEFRHASSRHLERLVVEMRIDAAN